MPTTDPKENESFNDDQAKQKKDEESTEFRSEAVFNKLLEEKKNTALKNRELQDRLNALEAKLKDAEQQKLLEKEDFKKWGETKEQEAKEWREKYETTQKTIIESVKKGAIKKELRKLGVDPSFEDDITSRLVNYDNVLYDGESKVVTGAESEAKAIAEKYAPLFGKTNTTMNHDAPRGDSFKAITLEEWKKLPYEEAMKRKEDLYKQHGIDRKR